MAPKAPARPPLFGRYKLAKPALTAPDPAPRLVPDNQPLVTPVQRLALPGHAGGFVWAKRDDLYVVAGVPGGKARSCWHLAEGAKGLITAGSRQSPQVNIVAQIAQRLGIPARVHVPAGPITPELREAEAVGAEIVAHRPGYNTVIVARARQDAEAAPAGWRLIPFGMECAEAIRQTRGQAAALGALPDAVLAGIKRLVVPAGSGMSLAGILWGMADAKIARPVLAVVVGSDPTARLDQYAPPDWRRRVILRPAGLDYHAPAPVTRLGGVALDPIYEAKCIGHLAHGDLLWIVGVRRTAWRADPPGLETLETVDAPANAGASNAPGGGRWAAG